MKRVPGISVVVMDIDGTLAGEDGTVPSANVAAIQAARARGVTVALASGRMTACIEPFFDRLGIDGPAMAYNGALIRGARAAGRPILHDRPLPAPMVEELIDFSLERRCQLNLYCDETLFGHDDPALAPYRGIYAGRTQAIYRLTDLARLRGRTSSKAVLVTDPAERERLHAWFEPRVGSRATLIRTEPEYLEFTGPGVDKGTGLVALAERLGVGLGSVAAIGDGDNDLAMLRAAGVAIAVRNAKESLKAVAHIVTRARSGDGAVAEALGELALC